MRHVGASAPPAEGSAAGVSSLCSSRQIRAAAPKATTHPASESGKNMVLRRLRRSRGRGREVGGGDGGAGGDGGGAEGDAP